MQILLTGASGFAGAHMLKYLLQHTDAVIYCPVTYRHGGHVDRIPSLITELEPDRVKIFEFDLATAELTQDLSETEIDLVINFASESHVDRSIVEPKSFNENNANLMINLLEFARKHLSNCKFVHISTDEVYGSIPIYEENIEWQRPHLPSNPYSASKSAQESLAIAYFRTYQIPLAIINSTNMIGEAQNQEKFLPKAIKKVLTDQEINVDTDDEGNMGSRKYVYVRDMAEAVWLVSQELLATDRREIALSSKPMKYHIAGSEEITNLDMVLSIGRFLDKEPKVTISPSPRPGYDLRYELATDKIRKLGWKESQDIYASIQQIVQWTVVQKAWLEHDHIVNLEMD
jgi:dTDP-glucose 4,6-dehydratase